MGKIFKREDLYNNQLSFDIKNNDLKAWAVYSRIEDTVIRIHYVNKISNQIHFDFITSPDIPHNESNMDNLMQNIMKSDLSFNSFNNYKIIKGY